jgi:hypothetical protein
MSENKIKIKKVVIELVENISNDKDLGSAVRKLINETSLLKRERKQDKSKKIDKKKHSNELEPMPDTSITKIKTSGNKKTHTFDFLFIQVAEFLNPYQIEDIKLTLEAIDENFVEEFKGKKKISKDWKDSHLIYTSMINIVTKDLFSESDKTGFPKAQKFCNIYLFNDENEENKENPENVKGIIKYFLNNRITQIETSQKK